MSYCLLQRHIVVLDIGAYSNNYGVFCISLELSWQYVKLKKSVLPYNRLYRYEKFLLLHQY